MATSFSSSGSEGGDRVYIPMSAYVIVDIDIHDQAGYEEYKRHATQTVTAYGGKYLARGGTTEVFEGSWKPNRLVILEFESIAQARAWLDSPEYGPPRALRHRTARTNMVVVEGVK